MAIYTSTNCLDSNGVSADTQNDFITVLSEWFHLRCKSIEHEVGN